MCFSDVNIVQLAQAGSYRPLRFAATYHRSPSPLTSGRRAPEEDLSVQTPSQFGSCGLACVLAASLAVAARPVSAGEPGRSVDLKPGQQITFAVALADGRLTLGPPRVSNPGGAALRDGEIAVAIAKRGLSPYADLTATERTAEPVDFVATGLIGDIKIDEIVVCGRLDAPASARIASGSWRVSLNRFAVRPGGAAPSSSVEGGLGCK